MRNYLFLFSAWQFGNSIKSMSIEPMRLILSYFFMRACNLLVKALPCLSRNKSNLYKRNKFRVGCGGRTLRVRERWEMLNSYFKPGCRSEMPIYHFHVARGDISIRLRMQPRAWASAGEQWCLIVYRDVPNFLSLSRSLAPGLVIRSRSSLAS